MSGAARAAPKGFGTRAVQALALAVIVGLLYAATRLTPALEGELGAVAAVGFLLLSGTLMSELLETIGLPHLSGYLLAGIVSGPYLLHLVDHGTVEHLSPVNTLALSLIALAGGAELRIGTLRVVARSLGYAMLIQCITVFVVAALAFVALSRYMTFTRQLGFAAVVGVALLWGVLTASRSPAACLGILAQTRAQGPLTTFSLAFVMTSDVVIVVFLALITMLARPLVTGSGGFSIGDLEALGHELLASIAFGVTLGLALAVYLRLVGRQLLLVLLVLGFVLFDFLNYIQFDPTLSFLVAGFVVQNLTAQGEKLLHAVEQTGSFVFVVFFATAGAHLNLPLLATLWPFALAFCAIRGATTWVAARWSSSLVGDSPRLRKWGWTALVSQAGLTLGLSAQIARAFPPIAEGFRSLAIAVVAINEMIGPVLFKLALDRTGETRRHEAEVSRSSLVPPESI